MYKNAACTHLLSPGNGFTNGRCEFQHMKNIPFSYWICKVLCSGLFDYKVNDPDSWIVRYYGSSLAQSITVYEKDLHISVIFCINNLYVKL